jgi:hypothetical protein
MTYTIARLVHRATDAMKAAGRPSIDASPAFLAETGFHGDQSPHTAAWSVLMGDRQMRPDQILPMPIAVLKTTDEDEGTLRMLIGIDMDGALAVASRQAGRTPQLVRTRDGGLTDPVHTEIEHLVRLASERRRGGVVHGSLDAMRSILDAMVPEIVHREVTTDRLDPERCLPTPWLDDVFAAVADAHGADQRSVLRAAGLPGRNPKWLWLGEDPREADGTPIPEAATGLPQAMPFFHLENRDDCDLLKIGRSGATYRRRGTQRFLAVTRDALPETVWSGIRPGIPASAILEMPGLDRYEAERVEEGETTLIHLRERT